MTYLLLENPWPMMLGLLGMSVVFLSLARRREEKQLFYASLISLVAAGGVWVLASVVESEREALIRKTRQLVAAAMAQDAQAVLDMLDAQATVTDPDGNVLLEGEALRDAIRRGLQRSIDARHELVGVDGEALTDTTGRCVLRMRTHLGGEFNAPVRTDWGIGWMRDGDGQWKIVDVRWLTFMGQRASPQMIRNTMSMGPSDVGGACGSLAAGARAIVDSLDA